MGGPPFGSQGTLIDSGSHKRVTEPQPIAIDRDGPRRLSVRQALRPRPFRLFVLRASKPQLRIRSWSPPSSRAATRRRARTDADRPDKRAANARSSRSVSGSGVAAVGSKPDATARGSSASARGLPSASARIRRRRPDARPGALASSTAADEASSSGSSRSSGNPARSIHGADPSRTANSMTIGSSSSRRATNVRTLQVATSSNWASSITSRSGAAAAISDSRSSEANAIRKKSGAAASQRPKAACIAARWGRREPVERAENGSQQPVQTGESDVRFRLKTRGHQRGQTMINSAAARRLEQRRLAHTRITETTSAPPRSPATISRSSRRVSSCSRPASACPDMTPPTPGSHQRLVTSQGNREGPRPFG